MDSETKQNIQALKTEAKRLGSLYVEVAKLTAAEKATMLMSAIALGIIILALAMGVLVFFTMSLVHTLGSFMPISAVYLLMGLIFILLIALIYSLRTPLIYNPVARFMSRLNLDPPTNPRQ